MADITYVAVFEDVAKLLAGVAPSVRGNVSRGKNTAAPLYRWFWVGCVGEQAKGFNPTTSRTLGDELHRVIVEIWARNEDDAMAMRRALLTAGRASIGFDRFKGGEAEVSEPWTDTDGIKVAMQITLRLPAIDTFLPETAPAARPGARPSQTVTDAVYPRVVPSGVDDALPAASPSGDGVLEFTET